VDFNNIYAQGFARLATRSLPVTLADPAANVTAVIDDLQMLTVDGVCAAVYPELCLTGYSCGDLFLQTALLDATEVAVVELVRASAQLLPVIMVGAPLRWQGRLYDCALIISGGRLEAVVPKSYLGFEERRWFASGVDAAGWIDIAGWSGAPDEMPIGAMFASRQVIQIADVPGLSIGVEIGDDMSVPVPPHAEMALRGATVLVNLSSSPMNVSQARTRHMLAQSASARCNAAFVFVAAGAGESTTDAAWDGQSLVYECGELLGESERFSQQPMGTVVDVDLRRIAQSRLRQGIQGENLAVINRGAEGDFSRSGLIGLIDDDNENRLALPAGDIGLRRPVARYPFVPDDAIALARHCSDVYSIQVAALARRLSVVGPGTKAVIGVSGGLDSTNALLVAAGAMDQCGRPRTDILGFTLPGFATSAGTKSNAWKLMQAVGVTAQEIDIRPAATQMLKDLGHPDDQYDVTYENVQAGLRADYLFRAANQRGGLVVGTGDLSESALGWCTYGVGDHMSHYNVNAGLPKTLMQHLIRWTISQGKFPEADEVLRAILDQEISPELVPSGQLQSSESAIGPYPLNDFFLWHLLQGASPSRIAYLAWWAWSDAGVGTWPSGTPDANRVAYDLATIRGWLVKFYQRFFTSQFKRSASPDGPQVLEVSLSPRGGWRMPSDATAKTWLDELERDVPMS